MARLNNDHMHLATLRDHFAKHRAMPPSFSSMSTVLGFRSANAAVKLYERLAQQGFLRKGPGGQVLPADRFFELPLMATTVQAGHPHSIEAQEAVELISLDGLLIPHPSRTVLIRVKGDSMRDVGILEGDLAIVERTERASEGQFVVAIVDDAFTLKELRFERQKPVLIAHNPDYHPIRPRSQLEIFGIVRGIARNLAATQFNKGRPV